MSSLALFPQLSTLSKIQASLKRTSLSSQLFCRLQRFMKRGSFQKVAYACFSPRYAFALDLVHTIVRKEV